MFLIAYYTIPMYFSGAYCTIPTVVLMPAYIYTYVMPTVVLMAAYTVKEV